jgi:hypothetical protein
MKEVIGARAREKELVSTPPMKEVIGALARSFRPLVGVARFFGALSPNHDSLPRSQVNSIYIDAGRFFGHEIYVQEDLLCTVDGVAYEREYTAVNDCYLFVLLDIDIAGILESYPMIGSQLKLALHQMICSQPPIKPTQQRARKQRKSIRAFAFGSSRKIHPGLAAAGAGADQVGKIRKLNDDLDKEMEEMENEIEKRHLETQELAEKAHEKELQEKSVHIGGTPDRSAHKRPSEDSA